MNCDTGHLVDIEKYVESFPELIEKGYEPVPEQLQKAAAKKLAGEAEAVVSRNSGGKLSRYAADLRKGIRQVHNGYVSCPKRSFNSTELSTCTKCKKHGGVEQHHTKIKCNFKEAK